MVEKGFELSEASNTPVMLEVRIRACHVHGRFTTKDNVRPAFTLARRAGKSAPRRRPHRAAAGTYLHEKEKIEKRWPAAVKFIEDHKLNEFFDGEAADIGIVMQGGMYNTALRAPRAARPRRCLRRVARCRLYVLNVTYPLVDDEFVRFCAGKKAILIVEEGQPEFIEQAVNTILRRADIQTKMHGKDMLPMAGEYTGGVVRDGVEALRRALPARTCFPRTRPARGRQLAQTARWRRVERRGAAAPAFLLHRLSRSGRSSPP